MFHDNAESRASLQSRWFAQPSKQASINYGSIISKVYFITSASSGFGAELAKAVLARGDIAHPDAVVIRVGG